MGLRSLAAISEFHRVGSRFCKENSNYKEGIAGPNRGCEGTENKKGNRNAGYKWGKQHSVVIERCNVVVKVGYGGRNWV